MQSALPAHPPIVRHLLGADCRVEVVLGWLARPLVAFLTVTLVAPEGVERAPPSCQERVTLISGLALLAWVVRLVVLSLRHHRSVLQALPQLSAPQLTQSHEKDVDQRPQQSAHHRPEELDSPVQPLRELEPPAQQPPVLRVVHAVQLRLLKEVEPPRQVRQNAHLRLLPLAAQPEPKLVWEPTPLEVANHQPELDSDMHRAVAPLLATLVLLGPRLEPPERGSEHETALTAPRSPQPDQRLEPLEPVEGRALRVVLRRPLVLATRLLHALARVLLPQPLVAPLQPIESRWQQLPPRLAQDVGPQAPVLGLAPLRATSSLVHVLLQHMEAAFEQGRLLGLRLVATKLLLPLVTEFALATRLLQRLLRPHKSGQVRLDLEDVLRTVLRTALQLVLIERLFKALGVGEEQKTRMGVPKLVPLLGTVRLPMPVFLLHHLSALRLDGGPLLNTQVRQSHVGIRINAGLNVL